MQSCAFFGHRNFNYEPHREQIKEIIVDLIENRGVTVFYNGYRGAFDGICAGIVGELREQYPNIKNVMVFSYMPDNKFDLPRCFDETVYLLKDKVPYKFAISRTNKEIVNVVDYVVSGVVRKWGGAKSACDYAKRLYKTVINVVDGSKYYDYDWVIQEVDAKMQDEQIRKKCKEENDKLYEEKIKPSLEREMAYRKQTLDIKDK